MLQFNFSHRFDGVVWNTVAYPQRELVLVEVRDTGQKQVSFSALNYKTNRFLWSDRKLEEAWWVNLSGVAADVALFTVYLDTNNPDKKALLAYSVDELKLLWWNNDFSVSAVEGTQILGFTSKLGLKEQVLNLHSGKEEQRRLQAVHEEPGKTLYKPVQYTEGMEYFETVRTFLADRLNFLAVSALEYLETSSCIIISGYIEEEGLANYLLVLSQQGELLLKEKLESAVKGIGLDTFFVLEGCLFFVKNKVELVSYTMI